MNREAKRRQIVETAIQMMETTPFEKLSVMDICRANNITKPTFYNYVENKEHLLFLYREMLLEYEYSSWKARKKETVASLIDGLLITLRSTRKMGLQRFKSYYQISLRKGGYFGQLSLDLRDDLVELYNKLYDSQDGSLIVDQVQTLKWGLSMEWLMQDGSFNLEDEFLKELIMLLGVNNV